MTLYTLVCLLLVLVDSIRNTLSQSDIPLSSFSNFSDHVVKNLYKCKCEANQVLVDDECVDEKTIVIAYSESLSRWIQTPTDDLGNVTVRDITCGNGSVPYIINSLFLSNRSLYDTENNVSFEPEHFCFEHIKNDNNKIVNSKVCQTVPSVPQCCNKGFIFDSNMICSKEDGFIFSPPFENGRRWKNISGIVSLINSCPSGYDLQVANVSDLHSLVYLILSENNEAILHKEPFEFEVELNMNFTEYCVAASKSHYGFYYQAYYCERNSTSYHEEMCKGVPCSRKCCPIDNVFNMNELACVRKNTGDATVPRIMSRSGFKSDNLRDNEPSRKIVTGPPFCSTFLTVDKNTEAVTLDGNGLLQVRTILTVFSPTEYCIEILEYTNGTEETIFVCNESITGQDCGWSYVLISSLLAISSLFLLLTLLVYVSLKDLRGRISGKCLMSEVLSLFVAYIVLIVLHTGSHTLPQINCQVTGFIEYIFMLASFFWLNVMCFDMWTTIRSHRPVDETSRIRFVLYSIYGWGSPLVMGFVAVAVDSLSTYESSSGVIRPGFGIKSCYFSDNASKWAYQYGIILILLVINLGFFIHIVVILMKAQKDNEKVFTNQNRSAGGNRDASKKRCWMYVKLFVVMGISWFAEVFSSITQVTYSNSCYIWLTTDIINALRGVLIFIIFVCKDTTIKKIYSKWFGDFAKGKRLSFLKSGTQSTQEGETATRSSNVSTESFPASRRRSTLSSSYKKNRMDSLSLSDIPEDPVHPRKELNEQTQNEQGFLKENP